MKVPFLHSSLIVALMLSTGCSPRSELPGDITDDVKALTARATISDGLSQESTVEESDESFIASDAQPAARTDSWGEVSIRVNGVDFYDIIAQVADNYEISLVTVPSVGKQEVSVNIINLSPVAAIKEIARTAGYVAAYNSSRNTITLTPRAIFTFKLPKAVFAALGEGAALVETDALAVGAVTGSPESDIEADLKNIVGAKANVNVLPAAGIITVEGDIHALDLAYEFLNRYLAVVTASLNIRAAIVAVNLTNNDNIGIDWNAILNGAISGYTSDNYTFRQTPDQNAGFVINVSTRHFSAVLDLLKTDNSIEVLSQPQLTLTNLQSAALFSGEKVPYLSSITSTTNATTGIVTTSGETSIANSGILLQVTGDILDKTRVQMRIQPTISSVREFRTFTLGANQLSVPLEDVSTTNSVVTLESGQTLILGGVRTSNQNLKTKDIPIVGGSPLTKSTEDLNIQKEFWILLNVSIAEGRISDALIDEKAML